MEKMIREAFWREGSSRILLSPLPADDTAAFEAAALSRAEEEAYRRLSSPKRRREFLGLRIALQLCPGSRLRYLPEGKPYVDAGQISVSHSGEYLSLIFDPEHPVGIDIEGRSERFERLAPRFLAPDEREYLSKEQLALAWSARTERSMPCLSRRTCVCAAS